MLVSLIKLLILGLKEHNSTWLARMHRETAFLLAEEERITEIWLWSSWQYLGAESLDQDKTCRLWVLLIPWPRFTKVWRNAARQLAVQHQMESARMHHVYSYMAHSCSLFALAHYVVLSSNEGTLYDMVQGYLRYRQVCFCTGMDTFLHNNNPQRYFPLSTYAAEETYFSLLSLCLDGIPFWCIPRCSNSGNVPETMGEYVGTPTLHPWNTFPKRRLALFQIYYAKQSLARWLCVR